MLSFSSCTSKHCAVQTVFWKKRELIANAIKMELYFLCVCGNHNGLLAQMEKQIKDYFLFFYLSYIFLFPLIVKVHILGLHLFLGLLEQLPQNRKLKQIQFTPHCPRSWLKSRYHPDWFSLGMWKENLFHTISQLLVVCL